jgi:hypothetical protein
MGILVFRSLKYGSQNISTPLKSWSLVRNAVKRFYIAIFIITILTVETILQYCKHLWEPFHQTDFLKQGFKKTMRLLTTLSHLLSLCFTMEYLQIKIHHPVDAILTDACLRHHDLLCVFMWAFLAATFNRLSYGLHFFNTSYLCYNVLSLQQF